VQRLLEKLFHTYYKDIYRYLYSFTRDTSLSEDLTSEVFLEVVKSFSRFRGESDIKTWLFSIARHKWIDYLRKKNRRIETEALSELVGEPLAFGSSGVDAVCCKGVEEQYLEKELLERINCLGIGPQGLGGLTTALAVHIEQMPTHIAGLPVAVNMQCHAARHKSAVI
jgi:RNA polymerase sigma factor (sigma-70 family)